MANLVRHICDFTCIANQSNFLEVLGLATGNKKNNGTYVTGVNMYITEKYLNGTYNSCSRVRQNNILYNINIYLDVNNVY